MGNPRLKRSSRIASNTVNLHFYYNNMYILSRTRDLFVLLNIYWSWVIFRAIFLQEIRERRQIEAFSTSGADVLNPSIFLCSRITACKVLESVSERKSSIEQGTESSRQPISSH